MYYITRISGIETKFCPKIPDTITPYSVVLINSKNGSRTIIHTNPNLTELKVTDLQERMNLSDDRMKPAWIHFEGRNIRNLPSMIQYLNENHSEIPISLEIEKVGRGLEETFLGNKSLIFNLIFILLGWALIVLRIDTRTASLHLSCFWILLLSVILSVMAQGISLIHALVFS